MRPSLEKLPRGEDRSSRNDVTAGHGQDYARGPRLPDEEGSEPEQEVLKINHQDAKNCKELKISWYGHLSSSVARCEQESATKSEDARNFSR